MCATADGMVPPWIVYAAWVNQQGGHEVGPRVLTADAKTPPSGRREGCVQAAVLLQAFQPPVLDEVDELQVERALQ
ncbi:hypothetical protein GCM10009663_76180 [Kitasatospora arboriphila]|uniref:Uncharacterized protein n=1 Tax=Kitasatospora arboriphila TaxID=258052 RepID=A0ABP4ER66_9ACTN